MSKPLSLDYVSPLPPVRSGIADYSLDLIPELATRCDLRVMLLDGQEPPPALTGLAQFAPASEIGGGRVPLYHMGNNPHHVEVWHLAHQHPGIVVLHDLVLHHLLIKVTLAEGDFDAYAERLRADHGWVGETTARARRWHELGHSAIFELPARRTLLRRQRGVLVHSRWAADTLRRDDPDLAVHAVSMGIPLPDPIAATATQAWRDKMGLSGKPLMGAFGFQTPIKRSERAIQALAQDALKDFHLVIGGEVSSELRLEEAARQAGVSDRVHFLGFLDFDEFETAIAACDLCLNLRYPSAGETSASMLRELAVGRPVIVSDYAQFAEIPDDIAVKVPLGEGEVESLAAAVGELHADPTRLARMSDAARQYVATEHDLGRAADRIAEAAADLAEREPLAERPVPGPTPTSLVWRELPGKIEVQGADSSWPVGEARRLKVRLSNDSLARWLSSDHKTGGILVDLHWRPDRKGQPVEQTWYGMPHDLEPGETVDFEVDLRRPIEDSNLLVIEPHIGEICGFNAVGGPSWELEME